MIVSYIELKKKAKEIKYLKSRTNQILRLKKMNRFPYICNLLYFLKTIKPSALNLNYLSHNRSSLSQEATVNDTWTPSYHFWQLLENTHNLLMPVTCGFNLKTNACSCLYVFYLISMFQMYMAYRYFCKQITNLCESLKSLSKLHVYV